MDAICVQELLVLCHIKKSICFHSINNKSLKVDRAFLHKMINSLGILGRLATQRNILKSS